METRQRILYLDAIKFLAIMWIFFVHFIADFRPTLFQLWDNLPYSLLLNGLTGKFATAMLAVVLGYLAFYKGSNAVSIASVSLKRYISFFAMGLLSNIIYMYIYGGKYLESCYVERYHHYKFKNR